MNEVIKLLKRSKALATKDHFVLTSGRHSDTYINKDALYPNTGFASRIGELFAEKNKDLDIDVVAGPALGGIILSQWTAFHLSKIKGKEILGVYTEKTEDKKMKLTRGYDKLVKGKNVLVVEDLTTTGGSVKKVIDELNRTGGTVIAASVMVNRNPGEVTTRTMGVNFSSLAELPAVSYEAKNCPLCEKNIPFNTSLGHGGKTLRS